MCEHDFMVVFTENIKIGCLCWHDTMLRNNSNIKTYLQPHLHAQLNKGQSIDERKECRIGG